MKALLTVLLLLPFLGISQLKKPKNVILLIGDGMGLSQLSTAYYFNNGKEPNFSRFPYIGLINTSSAKQKVTDSAAGATAFACGVRTYNGAVSVDTNETNLPNIVEIIEKKKVKSGIISTSSITHATPACFYGHALSRSMQDDIAAQLPSSGVDFFAGGGIKYFNNRSDKKNLFTLLEKNGFIIDTNDLNLDKILDIEKKYGYLLAPAGLPSKLEGRKDFLPNATQHGISYLKQSTNGFFLMVEGSQIDWEGHAINSDGIIQEVLDFDKAVGIALDYAEKNGETLVIVTADHETGGYALTPKVDGEGWNDNVIEPTFYQGADKLSYASHTATLIPVFAYGPYAKYFSGIYKNTDIFHKIMKATGWNENTDSKSGTTIKPTY